MNPTDAAISEAILALQASATYLEGLAGEGGLATNVEKLLAQRSQEAARKLGQIPLAPKKQERQEGFPKYREVGGEG